MNDLVGIDSKQVFLYTSFSEFYAYIKKIKPIYKKGVIPTSSSIKSLEKMVEKNLQEGYTLKAVCYEKDNIREYFRAYLVI